MDAATILIVEDNTTVAEDCRNCLDGLGYAVSAIAASGEGAVAREKDPSGIAGEPEVEKWTSLRLAICPVLPGSRAPGLPPSRRLAKNCGQRLKNIS